MGTTCEIVTDGPVEASEAAFEEIARVENLLSTWRDDSELGRLHSRASSGGAVASDELFGLLERTVDWARRTGSAFSPMAGPLVDVWQIRASGRVPDDAELAEALRRSSLDAITLDPTTRSVRVAPGARIEEGGFGKGYALDRAMEILARSGCRECLIDFGGQIILRARRPVTVDVAHPESRRRPALSLELGHGSLSTTSGSERWFDTPSGRLSHIIDPRSGLALPPRGSVTVLHESAFVADLLSTALYVLGPAEGLRWADAHGVAAIFIEPRAGSWIVSMSGPWKSSGPAVRPLSADLRPEGDP